MESGYFVRIEQHGRDIASIELDDDIARVVLVRRESRGDGRWDERELAVIDVFDALRADEVRHPPDD